MTDPNKKTTEPENIVTLSAPIQTELNILRGKMLRAIEASSRGSVIAYEAAILLAEKIGRLAELTLAEIEKGKTAIEKMGETLQEIIKLSDPNKQDETIKLTDEQAVTIRRYINGLGQEPLNIGTINSQYNAEELRLDLGEGEIVKITVYTDKGKVIAWKLNREKTEKEQKEEQLNLKAWLDRLLDSRSKPILILDKQESKKFLKTFTLTTKEGDQTDSTQVLSPRTFVTVTLSDGRKVTVTMTSNRSNDEYIATLQ